MKIVSLIPARGGSKSIPRKNLVPLNGRSLISYVIEASLGSNVEETWVSTEDSEIKQESLRLAANVLDRPENLALDDTPTEDVIFHFLQSIECDVVVLLQPTSPLTLSKDIDLGIEEFRKRVIDSLFSAVRPEDMLIWGEQYPSVTSLNYNWEDRGRRQDREQSLLIETGAFYIFRRNSFLRYKNRICGSFWFVELPFWRSFEIDTPEDLKMISRLMKK